MNELTISWSYDVNLFDESYVDIIGASKSKYERNFESKPELDLCA